MTVAKQFRWEAAHRLPWHAGLCRNLHGHSYRLVVELDGEPDDRGMLVDFHDLKQAMGPLVEGWDHAVLVAESDAELRERLEGSGWKVALLPCDTTSENLSRYVATYLRDEAGDFLRAHRVHTVRTRLQETESCYAVFELKLERAE